MRCCWSLLMRCCQAAVSHCCCVTVPQQRHNSKARQQLDNNTAAKPNSTNMTALLETQSQAGAQKVPRASMIASQLASRSGEQNKTACCLMFAGQNFKMTDPRGHDITGRVKWCLQSLHQPFAEPSEQAIYSTTVCRHKVCQRQNVTW